MSLLQVQLQMNARCAGSQLVRFVYALPEGFTERVQSAVVATEHQVGAGQGS